MTLMEHSTSPIAELVARARSAQRIYETWSQDQVDMAVAAAKNAGLVNTAHIEGGIDAWKKIGGPVVQG